MITKQADNGLSFVGCLGICFVFVVVPKVVVATNSYCTMATKIHHERNPKGVQKAVASLVVPRLRYRDASGCWERPKVVGATMVHSFLSDAMRK
jgi:hypothetical protein